MRATGFGIKSPNDASGEMEYPQRKPDGTNLDMGYKTLTEKRRELLYLAKLGFQTDGSAFKTLTGSAQKTIDMENSNYQAQSPTGEAFDPTKRNRYTISNSKFRAHSSRDGKNIPKRRLKDMLG